MLHLHTQRRWCFPMMLLASMRVSRRSSFVSANGLYSARISQSPWKYFSRTTSSYRSRITYCSLGEVGMSVKYSTYFTGIYGHFTISPPFLKVYLSLHNYYIIKARLIQLFLILSFLGFLLLYILTYTW